MQFCHGDLSLPSRAGVPATYGNGSVEVTSVIDGGHPDAVWSAACRARRNPRSTPPTGAALQPEPSAAVLGSGGSGGCDLLPEDHHLHRRPARPPERGLRGGPPTGTGREHAAPSVPDARAGRSRGCLPAWLFSGFGVVGHRAEEPIVIATC